MLEALQSIACYTNSYVVGKAVMKACLLGSVSLAVSLL